MRFPFRDHHLLALFEEYDRSKLPLDILIHNYFKSHKALGSKDRSYIAETAYEMMRWKGLLDFHTPIPYSWEKRLAVYKNGRFKDAIDDPAIPAHIRVSFPEELYQLFVNSYGQERAFEICLICNTQAPLTVRVNRLKTTRGELLSYWKKNGYAVSPCQFSEDGICFEHRINFFSLPEFKKGFFEVQDEASQLVAKLIKGSPGEQILDYCAGSGGKTLAFAPLLQNQGQIYLHDIRKRALLEARIRLKRAGVQNAQILHSEDPKIKKLKKKMDWVLVDAPCSGTGTLRRNPDMKWRFSLEGFRYLISQQRMIFEKGLSFLKPGGRIVYATCSLLKEENQEQTAHFLNTYSLSLEREPFISIPLKMGMDGFYGIGLKSFPRKQK